MYNSDNIEPLRWPALVQLRTKPQSIILEIYTNSNTSNTTNMPHEMGESV